MNGNCKRGNDSENKGKRRAEITELDIRKGKVGWYLNEKNLVGSLKLEGFTNLRTLIISSHQLIELDLSECKSLAELDCRSNELTSLNVNGCSNLKNIDCSNNNIRKLDLSTCPKLEVVNVNNCLELTSEKIKSNLYYNEEKGKLVKDDSKVKSGPQITKAKDGDTRNILIIGITGNGKSALANTLSDTSVANHFKEGSSSTSVTKNFQKSDIFEWQGKRYRIIDNIGFGDTNNISDKDVLFEIGKGIHSSKEGINQILFVFKGRFSPEHRAAFNLFKNLIAETKIIGFTTLVRTHFENFRTQQECQKDKDALLTQGREVTEIVNSCKDIIYVDNPSTQTSGDEKKRAKSKERVLNHLAENCQEIYKLKEWDSIHDQVAKCMNQIEKKEQELVQTDNSSEKTKLQGEIKENKNKIAEEVNVGLEASFGPLSAWIEVKNPNIWPFNKK
ncbi:GTPase [endosymbiont GvMRE of Glomus versiforme]|uniref:GTPase n=1 Tax=endosymbiont GvMRE of Glomus versiforme TaxID=2039283 RepID=UPI0011C49E34|nr:GTPase [endosymbiont GvMRE of Glomus versiforme]